MDAVTQVPPPRNEPVLSYAPGSPERSELLAALATASQECPDLPMWVDGRPFRASGAPRQVVSPHRHAHVLGTLHEAEPADVGAAVESARGAAPAWRDLPFEERAAVFLRAADLLAGPWRSRLNAATMLGQSKTAYQAEIDAACETIDFWRWNVAFARDVLAEQPVSAPGMWNRADHRPLEGFVTAITPFNFTAIAANLPCAPALMGCTVVWKPAHTQQLAAHRTMELLVEAGLPPGVITMVTGSGAAVSEVALPHPDLAGVHFTGSTATFRHLWRTVAEHLDGYRTYPRLVGETGGKDFVLAHPSADLDVLRTALVRGAFEYQGQKCSAASRAYVPASLWRRLRGDLADVVDGLAVGDVADLSVFMGAVIDDRAFARLTQAQSLARDDASLTVLAGGTADDTVGWFVRPTVVVGDDPGHEVFRTEYFGPFLAVHVWDDDRPGAWADVLDLVDRTAPYGLTGAIIARDRGAITEALAALRFTAGNVYVNDKPTGAVVGQQPFGGGRASGTNDKAGSAANLRRWTSTRIVKETFVPPKVARGDTFHGWGYPKPDEFPRP